MSEPTPPPLPPNLPAVYTPYRQQQQHVYPGQAVCPFCHGPINLGVVKCRHCGEFLSAASQSDGTAGCLGFFLGPVGLWYKGHWAAGFAWIVGFFIVVLGTGGIGVILAPVFWIGMAIHAFQAKPKR